MPSPRSFNFVFLTQSIHTGIRGSNNAFSLLAKSAGIFVAYRQPSVVGDDGWFVDKRPVVIPCISIGDFCRL